MTILLTLVILLPVTGSAQDNSSEIERSEESAHLILAPPGAATELGLLDELANATLEDSAGIHDVH
jgi:hypothetical protein